MVTNPLLGLPHLEEERRRVEFELEQAVQTGEPALTEMAGHLIKAGGKRIRPLFAVAAAHCAERSIGPVDRDVILGGVAVELVHIGSLHHDDVIDEASTRRTVASVNARWGNLRAILSGDFLLARASEIAVGLGSPAVGNEVAGLLAGTIARLCDGEVAELQSAYQVDRSEASYLRSIDGKTASLLRTATRIGAVVAGLPRSHVEALARFGTAYGMAFQIVDDILDLVSTDEELGKPSGHDLVEGVYTLPVLRALAGPAGPELRSILGKPVDDQECRHARDLVRSGTAIDQAMGVAAGFAAQAADELAPLAHRPAAQALIDATTHLLDGVDATMKSLELAQRS